MSWSLQQLHAPSDHLDNNSRPVITRLMHAAWAGNPLLRSRFPLDNVQGRRRFSSWYRIVADRFVSMSREWPQLFRGPLGLTGQLARQALPLLEGDITTDSTRRAAWRGRMADAILDARTNDAFAPTITEPPAVSAEFGATLIGYARAELGLGDYLRNTAAALEAAAVPFAVLDCGHIAPQRKADARLDAYIHRSSPYRFNLFQITADKMHDAIVSFPPDTTVGRYNIGGWMWELPRFPADLSPCIGLVDEVWAPSAFVRDALAGLSIPVVHMPVCVSVAELTKPAARSEFGLPDGPFLFGYSFDVYSSIERKNPVAAIRAFRRAFPNGNEPAGLVLKVMNANEADARWKALRAEIAGEPRIHVVSETLDRGRWLALLNLCDTYLSLHRSEGFGFGPAEAMLLGKPVILTGYGGVTDFANSDTALIVPHRLVPVGSHYMFGEGQVWADPDIDRAAEMMRRLVADRDLARRVGEAGAQFIRRHHSPASVGSAYRRRLDELARGPTQR